MKKKSKLIKMGKIVKELTYLECIDLALHNFLIIDGINMYRKSKHCYLADALSACEDNEIIVKNKSMHYILSKTKPYENRKQNNLLGPCEKLRY